MIPQPFTFYAETIQKALIDYTQLMPVHLEEFEKEHGPGVVKLINIIPYSVGLGSFGFCAIATIWQDEARLESLAATKKITEGGSDLLNSLSNRLTQVFNTEGCDHDYQSSVDDQGNEKIICSKCGTPLS